VLQHCSLEIAPGDAEAALAFWALLGFARVDPPPALRERTRWVERAGTQIHLLLAERPVAPPQGHAAVVVEAYDEVLERLRAAGYAPEPRAEHWGAPRAFVRAPGGHRVELMAVSPSGDVTSASPR
jgi:catechol 2,3-dioxygenase-like lactoylglutathione lyase family enzyme